MIIYLIALFIATPVVELFILLKTGAAIGALPTVAAVVFTAVVGAALVRRQGRAALDEARMAMNQGETPVAPAIHGAFILVAGLFLLTPGFVTDAIGFLFLIPAVRLRIGRAILSRLRAHMGETRVTRIHISRDPYDS